MDDLLATKVEPNWQGLRDVILRKGDSDRVYNIELFLDPEMQEAVVRRFGLCKTLDPSDPYYTLKRQIELQCFLGYDFIRCSLDGMVMPLHYDVAADTADMRRERGRSYINEHTGPIMSWEDFERYPWPDPHKLETRTLDWCEENLPENMCVMGSGGFAHFAEYLTWLMGYETFCIALYEQRDLVAAIAQRLVEIYEVFMRRMLKYDRVKLVWGSDDMGYRGGPLCSPDDMREFILPGHQLLAKMSHDAGRPYLLHSCGNLALIMDDLIDGVKIDAKHSFEDTIEDVREAKHTYGRRVALLGGLDVDFLCRHDADAVRARVRDTLDKCMPGGGYALGTGNSVANYIPLDNYLAMLDEGRRWGR